MTVTTANTDLLSPLLQRLTGDEKHGADHARTHGLDAAGLHASVNAFLG